MNASIFAGLMIATFIAALIALVFGIGSMGKNTPSTKFMMARVGLCLLLLSEILIYVMYLR